MPPRPRTPPHGLCGDPHPHFVHDWQTNVAAGSFWFRCPGREFGHSWPRPRTERKWVNEATGVIENEPQPRPKTELRRVTIHEHDDRLKVMTLRGVGFSWRCTCGERGRICRERSAALHDKALHEAGHTR